MIFRFGWKVFQRDSMIKTMIILLLVATFLIVMAAVSMLEVKLKKYSQVSEALEQNGRVLVADAGLYKPDTGAMVTEGGVLQDLLPSCDEIWSVTELLFPYYGDEQECAFWLYSKDVVDSLSPDLAAGRWFDASDMESDTLKVVVSYNQNQFQVGDIVHIWDSEMGVDADVEIIGVMEDRASIFGFDTASNYGYTDYRMLFTTYSYEREGGMPLFIAAEQQVIDNEDKGWFEEFNCHLNTQKGFIRSVRQCVVLRYPESVPEEDIVKDIQMLQINSTITGVYSLRDVRESSRRYITEELYSVIPIIICILIYIIMATLSISAISAKRSLHNYAAYYLCGMQWRQCSMISLVEAGIIGGVSFVLMLVSMAVISVKHMFSDTALHLGWMQLLACVLILFLYVFLAWLLPRSIVRGTSAREILKNNG